MHMKKGTTAKAAPGSPATAGGNGAKQTRKDLALAKAITAGVKGAEKMTYKELRDELTRLKKAGLVEDGRRNNGGHEGAGQQAADTKAPTLVEERISHLEEIVDITITDREGGVVKTAKRKSMLAILDSLRMDALSRKNNPAQRTAAAHEYFDRTLGKAPQPVAMKHSGEVGSYTAKRPSKAALAAKRAYERANYVGETE